MKLRRFIFALMGIGSVMFAQPILAAELQSQSHRCKQY